MSTEPEQEDPLYSIGLHHLALLLAGYHKHEGEAAAEIRRIAQQLGVTPQIFHSYKPVAITDWGERSFEDLLHDPQLAVRESRNIFSAYGGAPDEVKTVAAELKRRSLPGAYQEELRWLPLALR